MSEFMIKIKDMRFLNADDFYVKKAIIKEKYKKLDYDDKEMYKWYFFYQLCMLKNPLKTLFWNYLNSKNDNSKKLNEEYIKFCEKRDKIAKTWFN